MHLKKNNSALRDAAYLVHQDHRMAICILKIKEQRAFDALVCPMIFTLSLSHSSDISCDKTETKEEKKKLKQQLRAIVRYNEDVMSMAQQLALSYKNIKVSSNATSFQ